MPCLAVSVALEIGRGLQCQGHADGGRGSFQDASCDSMGPERCLERGHPKTRIVCKRLCLDALGSFLQRTEVDFTSSHKENVEFAHGHGWYRRTFAEGLSKRES